MSGDVFLDGMGMYSDEKRFESEPVLNGLVLKFIFDAWQSHMNFIDNQPFWQICLFYRRLL